MKQTTLVPVLALVALLSACKPATQVPSLDHVYTVDDFDRNFDLRQRVLVACATNPGELKNDPNCVNSMASHLGNARDEDRQYEVRKVAAAQDIAVIMVALKLFHIDNGSYPSQVQGLRALVEKPTAAPIPGNWKDGGYLERLPNDPWGHPYQFLNPGAHGEIDVYSNGMAGPSGDAKTMAIGSWQPEIAAEEKAYIEQQTQSNTESNSTETAEPASAVSTQSGDQSGG
jgi:general secretion pathway protein G